MSTERRLVRRISLRTLLVLFAILSAILALLVAPIGRELARVYAMQRQVQALEAAGCEMGFSNRVEDYSLWLTRNVWPMRVKRLGEEIYKISVVRQNQSFDVATLQGFPTVENIELPYGFATSSDVEFRASNVRIFRYEAGSGAPAIAEPDVHLLRHFPNVLIVELARLPADSLIHRDLADCPKLTNLELSLVKPSGPKLFDVAPLRGLKHIASLKVDQMPENTDWSFLRDMANLRGALINPQGILETTAAGHSRYSDHTPANREQTPLHHLAKLPLLAWLELNGTPAYAADLATLAEDSQVSNLRLERVPEGPRALAGLRQAKQLRRLHLYVSQFDDLAGLAQELLELKQLTTLTCEFHTLTIEHVAMLEKLSDLDELDVAWVEKYEAGAEGVERLLALPLVRFRAAECDEGAGQSPHCVELRTRASDNAAAAQRH